MGRAMSRAVTLFLLLAACPAAHQPTGVGPTTGAAAVGESPVSFGALESRLQAVLAVSADTDQQDRLVALRDLMMAMRNREPSAQRRVYEAVERLLVIEERTLPQPLVGVGTTPVDVVEEVIPAPVDTGTVLADSRKALAENRPLDAVALLAPLTTPEAATLRKEAIDTWARSERERVGHAFVGARAMPPGPERVEALEAVRVALVVINERFPDNAYAQAIRDNLAKVEADLKAVP